MRTVVHLSDVHFGRTDPRVVAELIASVHKAQPDVVAVSGDLTQRARTREFEEAREFLNALPQPQIVVPGNHDVPLHNVYDRFYRALHAYRSYISDDLEPFFQDEEIAILGLNTSRSLTIKNGSINNRQMDRVEARFCTAGPRLTKILVTHHPFDLPQDYRGHMLVGRASKAMARFARCGVDLLLAGHFHLSHSGPTALRYSSDGYSGIFVQAGTACSTRGRGEHNSFNILRIEAERVTLEVQSSEAGGPFHCASLHRFEHTEAGWRPAPPDTEATGRLDGPSRIRDT